MYSKQAGLIKKFFLKNHPIIIIMTMKLNVMNWFNVIIHLHVVPVLQCNRGL